jgi:predicted small secreted protein|tara:strand:- start:5828 stop:5953 length:126 start_codon:yes stop_codon:yes gene_type:complete
MSKVLKYFIVFFILSSCGTIGGVVSGVGEDIKNVGDFIKSD